MSWLLSTQKPGENVTAPDQHLAEDAPLFGPLTPEDLHWTCSTSIITETQTWYATLPNKKVAMVQIIHSGVGLWQVQIQFTFGLYDILADGTAERNWKSVSVTNFVCPAPPAKGVSYDKRSVKSDQFSILVDPAAPDTYHIRGTYDNEVAVSLQFSRLPGVPGWKLGSGPRGGMTYFGQLQPPPKAPHSPGEPDKTGGYDGYCVHRFWPRCSVTGIIRHKGQVIELPESTRGVFIHAVQGMRPNLIANRWNFADLQSIEEGVSLIMMEFTAIHYYGDRKVTIGSVVVDDKLVAVTYGPSSGVIHQDSVLDTETGYKIPRRIIFPFSGPAIGAPKDTAPVVAELVLDLPEDRVHAPTKGGWSSKHLICRVSVLAEVPTIVRKIVQASGTNPYIYQWLVKDSRATLSLPALDGREARQIMVTGPTFCEASFVSEP